MFALLFGAGLQMLLRRGKSWIRARLSWLVLFGLAHAIFLWDGDILLAYGLIGLVCWRMIREAKETFQLLKTGVVLYLIGVAVLLLLGFVSHGEPGNFWQPGVAELQYEKFWKLQGGFEAWRSRADLLSSSLLAIGAQYGWELAGLMLFGAGLMRSGWLRGSYSSGYYLRQAAWLLPLSVLIQLPAVALQWQGPLGLSLERFPAAGAARAGRPAAGDGLSGAVLRFLARAVAHAHRPLADPGGTHGAEQLPAANADLHHAVLSLRPL